MYESQFQFNYMYGTTIIEKWFKQYDVYKTQILVLILRLRIPVSSKCNADAQIWLS